MKKNSRPLSAAVVIGAFRVKMDQDFLDYLGRNKLPSCNRTNMIKKMSQFCLLQYKFHHSAHKG